MSFYGQPTGSQFTGMTRGRFANSLSGPLMYPNPFFDLAQTYLPQTIQDLFRWCKYYYLTNSILHSIVVKQAVYPITEIIIKEDNDDLHDLWSTMLHKNLKIRQFQIDAGLDYHCYGNSLVSIAFPFHKVLRCDNCGWTEHIRHADYTYRSFDFYIHCRRCGFRGRSIPYDIYVKAPQRIRLIRWNPEDVEIESLGKVSGDHLYHLRIPQQMYNDLMVGRPDVIESTPQIFIQAAKDKKMVAFSRNNLYHMRRPSLSSEYEGWGISRMIAVMKDAFLFQLMKKATEALLTEHILPLRVLFPETSVPGVDPYVHTNLGRWKEEINLEIQQWRLDPNRIPVLPLPIGSQTIGGQGRALLLLQEIMQMSELITVGYGVPKELIWGGMSWSGSSVSLRMLENDFLRYMEDQQGLLNWVIDRVAYYMEWPSVEAEHKQFKMADDLNRQQLALNMRQLGEISSTTLLQETDHDPRTETELKQKESAERRDDAKKQALLQAESQGKMLLTQTRYQAKAMALQQQLMGQPVSDQMGQAQMQGQEGGVGGMGVGGAPATQTQNQAQGQGQNPFLQGMTGQQLSVNPALVGPEGEPANAIGYDLRQMVASIKQQMEEFPDQAPEIMNRLQAEYPQVYQAVAAELSSAQQPQQLPEQRAPRCGPGSAVI